MSIVVNLSLGEFILPYLLNSLSAFVNIPLTSTLSCLFTPSFVPFLVFGQSNFTLAVFLLIRRVRLSPLRYVICLSVFQMGLIGKSGRKWSICSFVCEIDDKVQLESFCGLFDLNIIFFCVVYRSQLAWGRGGICFLFLCVFAVDFGSIG